MNIDYLVLCLTHNLWVTSIGGNILTSVYANATRYSSLRDIPDRYADVNKYKIVTTNQIEPNMGNGKKYKTVYVLYNSYYNYYYQGPNTFTMNSRLAKQFKDPEYAEFARQDFFVTKEDWCVQSYEIEDNSPINTDIEDVNDLITNMRQEIENLRIKLSGKYTLISEFREAFDQLYQKKQELNDLVNSQGDELIRLKDANNKLSYLAVHSGMLSAKYQEKEIEDLKVEVNKYKDRCVYYKRTINENYGIGTDKIAKLEEENKELKSRYKVYDSTLEMKDHQINQYIKKIKGLENRLTEIKRLV